MHHTVQDIILFKDILPVPLLLFVILVHDSLADTIICRFGVRLNPENLEAVQNIANPVLCDVA